MMNKWSKWLRLGVFALLGLGVSWLVSCSRPVATSGTEIEFWTMQLQPQFTAYFEGLIEDFEAENPGVKVRWVDVPWEAMESKILTSVAANTAPDVVNLNPKFASQLASREAWLNLDEQLSEDDQRLYLPKIWQASTLNGKTFGLPWYLTTQVTIYNRALLEAAGIENPPQTYEELATVARQVKDQTGKFTLFVTLIPEDSGAVLESLVKMGVTLVDESGKAAFNSPEGVAAFEYWVNLYREGLLPPEVLTRGHRYGIDLYQTGEAALVATGPQFLNAIATNAPDIAEVSGVAPEITGETGKKNVAVMNLTIPRTTRHPEEAVKFALFVTNSQNQLAFAQEAKVLPSTQEAVAEFIEVLESSSELSPQEEAVLVGAKQLQDAEVLIPAMDNLNVLQRAIYENLQAAMLGQKTIEQALADAAQQWDQDQS
nr:sugar ABC transporter substrate-binding protein [Spirulina subsalsa]